MKLFFALILLLNVSYVFANEVRLVKEGGVYHLPVKINDAIELKFVVDTGAADVHIPADVALTLMRTGTISKQDFLGTAPYQMADGTIKENATLNLRSLQVGAVVIRNIAASIGPLESTLLLGQSALEKLEPWHMDTRRGILVSGDSSVSHLGQTSQDKAINPQPFERGVIYFAAELPPTDNIPPESPLCYKFQVTSPEEQLKKLNKKYTDIYDSKISKNIDGSKNLVAKRRDEGGNIINFFYSTSPIECNNYQTAKHGKGVTGPTPSSPLPISYTHTGDEWLYIVSNQNRKVYYLPSSVKKEGEYIRFWEKSEYNPPEQISTDKVSTLKSQVLYDCKYMRYQHIYYISYDSQGNTLRTGNNESKYDPWTPIVPDSIGEIMFNTICRN